MRFCGATQLVLELDGTPSLGFCQVLPGVPGMWKACWGLTQEKQAMLSQSGQETGSQITLSSQIQGLILRPVLIGQMKWDG